MINGGIFMSKNEQFEHRIISNFISDKITRNKASELIGKTERSITRIARVKAVKKLLKKQGLHTDITVRPIEPIQKVYQKN